MKKDFLHLSRITYIYFMRADIYTPPFKKKPIVLETVVPIQLVKRRGKVITRHLKTGAKTGSILMSQATPPYR